MQYHITEWCLLLFSSAYHQNMGNAGAIVTEAKILSCGTSPF